MQHKDQVKRIVAGVFLFFCMALIVFVVFTIGLEKGFTEPKVYMSVLFGKVGGLMEGAPVRLSGVTIGTVSEIDFMDKEVEGRGVKVILSLYKKYEKQLHKISKISIVTEGVLGEKIVDMSARPGLYREDLARVVIGADPLEAQDLAVAVENTATALTETTEGIQVMLMELQELAVSMKRLMNRVEQRIIDGNLFKVF